MNLKSTWILGLSALALAVGSAELAGAAQKTQQKDRKTMEAAAGRVGRMHKAFERFQGDWRADTTIHAPEGGGEPMTTTGTVTNTLIFGGRFLRQEHVTEVEGQELRSLRFLGYSNDDETFQTVSLDNFNTAIDFSDRGEVSDDGNTIITYRTDRQPQTGKDVETKEILVFEDQRNCSFTRYVITPDGEKPTLFVKYTRQ